MIKIIKKPISDFGTVITGKTPPTSSPEDFGGNTLFVTPPDFTQEKIIKNTSRTVSGIGTSKLIKKLLPKNAVMITCIGEIGNVAMTSKPTITNQQINSILIEESKYSPDYIYYLLKNSRRYLTNNAGQTVLAILGKIEFEKIALPVFVDKVYQRKIASVLSSFDSKIELNNRINAELEAMAKTIYDYWFVQFDFPDKNGKPYKSSGGKMVWNEELKREIPESWEVKRLDDCIQLIIDYRGKTPKKINSDWSENSDDIIALSAKHVKNGKLINLESANRVDDELYKKWMKDELKEGDILLTSEAPCGEFFYLVGKTKYCLSQRLFAIRSNLDIVHHAYLYFELSKGNGISQILGKVSGSTVFGIRQDELRTVNILIPEMKIQDSFAKLTSSIFKEIRTNEYQISELALLRDWLLPMLMNGQVKIN